MRRCNRALLRVLLLSLVAGVLAFPGPQSARVQDAASVSFRWAFGALVHTEQEPKLLPITQDTTLKTGDQLKMFVELTTPCFVYVIYYGPQAEVRWLFPYQKQQFDTDYQPRKRYDIPQGETWLRLDHQVGQETFYLLASSERLVGLETLLGTYADAAQDAQAQIATQIVAEIREVKQRRRQLSTPAERPAPIAGNVRGPDIGTLAVEISAQHFYSKTFTIEHR